MQREVQRLGAHKKHATITCSPQSMFKHSTSRKRHEVLSRSVWLHLIAMQGWSWLDLSGASALDKRTKQRLQVAELEKLGAKRQKGSRIPASIGLGALLA